MTDETETKDREDEEAEGTEARAEDTEGSETSEGSGDEGSDDLLDEDEIEVDEDGIESGKTKSKREERKWDNARVKVEEMEDDPPSDLEDWPSDHAKYVTFGGSEGDHGYDEGPERNLGPSSVRRFEDGSVEVEGEKVDNPEDYKSTSIIGDSDHPDDA